MATNGDPKGGGATNSDPDSSETEDRRDASAHSPQAPDANGENVNGGSIGAGHRALGSGAWQDADAFFRAALAEGETGEALEGLGEAAWWLDDIETAFSSRERAYHLYRQRGDDAAAARVAMLLATDHFAVRAERAVASGWFQRAVRLLEKVPTTAEHGWLAAWEAHVALLDSGPHAVRSRTARAVEVGHMLGIVELEMLAVALDGLATVYEGEVELGMLRLDEAAAAAASGECHDRRVEFTIYSLLLNACRQVGDFERVAEWNNVIGGGGDRWACPPPFATCRVDYASVLMWRGEWSQAEEELSAVLEKAASHPGPAARAAASLAELRRRQGMHSAAADLLEHAASTRKLKPVEAEVTVVRAELMLDEGDAVAAAGLAARFLRRPQLGHHWDRLRALSVLVRAQLKLDDLEAAEATLDRLRSMVASLSSGAAQASWLMAEGIVVAARGESEQARQRLEDAVALFDETGGIYETEQARLELAAVLVALGRLPAAAREAAAALAVMSRLGTADARRAEALLARVEAEETPRETGRQDELVLRPREREVLRLMALGRRNSEIAEELFLSTRTVERHISNIYRSLGVSGKAGRAVAIRTALRAGLISSSPDQPEGRRRP